jgi:hypothetical protein
MPEPPVNPYSAPQAPSNPPPSAELKSKQATGPIPVWGWVFVAACGIIPILTLGGALPAAIGIGGAAGCANISRKASVSVPKRVAICAGITMGCWTLLGAFLALVVSLNR